MTNYIRKYFSFSLFCFLSAVSISAGASTIKHVYTVTLNDGVIKPQIINVPAHTTFKIIVKNIGTTPAEFESLRIPMEKVLAPGVTSFVVIRRLSPGKYKYYDEFHMHKKTAHGAIISK